jgi:FkbM family methyltransferase
MRIAFMSNSPWTFTGYANQTALFVPRLQKAGHDMAIISVWGHEGTPIAWNGVQVFGKSVHPYAQDIMHSHAETWKADAMISLMDAWVVEPEGMMGTRWVPWFPVDSEPLPKRIYNNVKQAYDRIVFSKFACQQLDAAGLDYTYIPHGVNTNVFKPLDRAACRETMKLPADKFIVGMVAANKGNPPRKAFHPQIAAFAALKAKYSDCVLYLHTLDGTRGYEVVDLRPYIEALGLKYGYAFKDDPADLDVIFADQYGLALGYPDEQMAMLYNAMDVHVLVSMGEGFGIPILEAQACGTPVIVGDWTSMSELCFSGYKVAKSDAEPIYNNLQSFWYLPHASAIAELLEKSYHNKGVERYRTWAREGALEYDADLITEKYWLPYLAKLQERIDMESRIGRHAHRWGSTGLIDKDGLLYIPCLDCSDGLQVNQKTETRAVIPNRYPPLEGLSFVPDTDGITKIVTREIQQDYDFDNLDLQPGDVVIDVGAHKGIVSCYLAKRYPGVRVFAFEPAEENYSAAIENIKRNNGIMQVQDDYAYSIGESSILLNHAAVTCDGRDVEVYLDPGNSGGNSTHNPSGIGQCVHSVSLKSILDRFERVALLKMDCEGAEYELIPSVDDELRKVDHFRGEFHLASQRNSKALLDYVSERIADTKVTMNG